MKSLACAVLALSSLCSSAAATQQPSAPRPWTILVYGGADNNADGPILRFLDAVRKAIDDDPGIELLLLLDRSKGFSDDARSLGEDFTGTRLYRLRKDSAERLAGGAQFPELVLDRDTELDTADAENLRRFIAWGKAQAPARHYGVMIYSHADGRTMCPDEQSENDMGIPELSAVLTAQESVDFLALELCNMSGIEIAYEWRPGKERFGAEVLLAIPNAGPPLDWDRAFARIRTPGHATTAQGATLDPARMEAADFGRLVVEEGRSGRELAAAGGQRGNVQHEAAACLDLRASEAVKRALDALSVQLANSDSKQAFLALRDAGPQGQAINYDGDGPLVDLYDLCKRAAASERLGADVRAAAQAVMAAVDACVLASFGMSGYAGFEDGKHGVFVVLPSDKPGRWKRFDWYTPRSFEARGKQLGQWAFLRDGATASNDAVENWFELLDYWFDELDDVGGVNGYTW